ncbi:response regulator [Desulfohalovibrio reitneri]|uniref:response regulator n=1 Tax=Desulfohalovibrio reitneri TaxID=1307759 RepID=UPI0004A705DE|nr:response regulator [Desulfohalovibrio reitneri]
MRALIVDDDFYCRSYLQEILHPYGYCDVAVNGDEAIYAFRRALSEGKPYDLICMDLVMPEIDGHNALREIRDIEQDMGVAENDGVKVIITTVLEDNVDTHNAFFLGGATSYLVKPIDENVLLGELRKLGLIDQAA